jgi:hypothetical protein
MYNRVGSFIARRMRTRLGQVSLGMMGIGIFLVCHGLYLILSGLAKAAGWV